MTLYEACCKLNIWPAVKARAEVWANSKINDESLNNLRTLAKNKFRTLAMTCHPDKGGSHDEYVKIQLAYDIIKIADGNQLITALNDEEKSTTHYFKPGANECLECTRWVAISSLCATTSCTGFKKHEISSKNKFWTRSKRIHGKGFFTGSSQGLGQKTG